MSLDVKTEETSPEETGDETIEEQKTEKRATYVFPVYSVALIGCLVLVFVSQMYFNSNSFLTRTGVDSTDIAGLVKRLFLSGEYWRILTSSVVHGSIAHLVLNCYAFYVLGRLVETLSNRSHLAIVFLVSAIGSGALSLSFMPENGASVGASGGIAGFLGYLAVYGYLRRKLLSSAFLKSMLFNIGFMVVVGISINAAPAGSLPRIDNFGHLGGLLTGAFYGLIQIPGDVYEDPREISQATEIVGLVSLGTIVAVCGFTIWQLLRAI